RGHAVRMLPLVASHVQQQVSRTGQIGTIVRHVHEDAVSHLLELGQANRRPSLLAGSGKRRQQNRNQEGDDGDHHQDFNKGKTARTTARMWVRHWRYLFVLPGDAASPERATSADGLRTGSDVSAADSTTQIVILYN